MSATKQEKRMRELVEFLRQPRTVSEITRRFRTRHRRPIAKATANRLLVALMNVAEVATTQACRRPGSRGPLGVAYVVIEDAK